MLLSNGIFVNGGKMWFWLNKNGEHCEMISAVECMTPIRSASSEYAPYGRPKSRFAYPLEVEGIEFQPLEKGEYQVLKDEEVDTQTISDSDTYWEQRLAESYGVVISCKKWEEMSYDISKNVFARKRVELAVFIRIKIRRSGF
ncbi:hypothetical protein L2E82_48221 [Cichorium intybus]|uniref:Uncharacterized protein n=1 Tax=Cichorium intybus TaxID=13427 RepID=A0ACB8YXJ8_CICIN|nr:hypothetical protein L2E82_48221 [Cichorium intybus]